jgi:hypothetical protein
VVVDAVVMPEEEVDNGTSANCLQTKLDTIQQQRKPPITPDEATVSVVVGTDAALAAMPTTVDYSGRWHS